MEGQQGKAMWHELDAAEKDEETELKKIFDSFGSLMDKAQTRGVVQGGNSIDSIRLLVLGHSLSNFLRQFLAGNLGLPFNGEIINAGWANFQSNSWS